jgi:hypothetical protein
MTKSELVRDAATTALSASLVVRGIKGSSKALIITGVAGIATILTVDILIAVREKKIEKNNNEEA